MKRQFGVLLLGTMMLGFAGYGPPAGAQDDADVDEEQPAKPRNALFVSDEQFEQWFDQMVYNRTGGLEQTRRQYQETLSTRINELVHRHGLNAAQKKKLELAGKRDIQRMLDFTEEKKAAMKRALDNRDQFLAIYRELRTSQVRMKNKDPFDGTSLLGKTLKTTLANEPVSKDAKEIYRSHVESVVSLYDERLGLSGGQHRRFVALIVEETPPLKFYGEYDTYAVMFQVSWLPEAEVARILNPGQMRLLHDRFLEARTYEKVLIANGYLAGAGADGKQPGAGDGANGRR